MNWLIRHKISQVWTEALSPQFSLNLCIGDIGRDLIPSSQQKFSFGWYFISTFSMIQVERSPSGIPATVLAMTKRSIPDTVVSK